MEGQSMKDIGIVICNFNKKEYILNCVQSVLNAKGDNYDVFVVDNASTDGSAEALAEQFGDKITLLVNEENLGGAGGFDFSGADFSDIFGDIFGDFFGGGRRSSARNNGPMKGANLRTSVRITFEEAVFGVDKELDLTLKDTCKCCNGTGAKPGTSPETCHRCGERGQVVTQHSTPFGTIRNSQVCPDCGGTGKTIKEKCTECHGSGYTSARKKIQVSIPAGIDNGQSVRLRDKGEPGVNGGPRGDLLVEVVVERHPIFQRQDMNIFSTVPISYAVAALGGEVLIDTVDGKVVYDVKAGTQTDTRVRLRGKGVPSLRNKDIRGDQYVTLVVQVPDKLSNEAKELLRKFDKETGNSLEAVKNMENKNINDEKKDKKRKFFK